MIAHVVGILMLFVLPEFLTSMIDDAPHHSGWMMYAKSGMFVVVFYVNFLFLVDYCFRRPHSILRLVGYNIVLTAVIIVGIQLLFHWQLEIQHPMPPHKPAGPPAHWWAMKASWILRDLMMVVLTIALAIALRLTGRWLTLERDKERLEALSRRSELQSLKNQLNPHFLFNTLNSIYALIAIDPDKTQGAVHTLSRMLRYVLYDSGDSVSLGQEIDFVDNYASLIRLRLCDPDKLHLDIDIDGEQKNLRIAPLLFITLVENVFKHGDTSRPMTIAISADAHGRVTCHTENHLGADRKSPGIGLDNLRRRLHLLYPRTGHLNTQTLEGIFISDLSFVAPESHNNA